MQYQYIYIYIGIAIELRTSNFELRHDTDTQ